MTLRIACVLACLALVACDRNSVGSTATAAAATVTAAPSGPVDVPAKGKRFEPPVQASQLPGGAWYCDMGTVHWAQLEEGSKACPLCKMDLKQKGK